MNAANHEIVVLFSAELGPFGVVLADPCGLRPFGVLAQPRQYSPTRCHVPGIGSGISSAGCGGRV